MEKDAAFTVRQAVGLFGARGMYRQVRIGEVPAE